MKLPNLSLNPKNHIAYFPYGMGATSKSSFLDFEEPGLSHAQMIEDSTPNHNNRPQKTVFNSAGAPPTTAQKMPTRHKFKNTLVGHLYTLFTAPIE